MDQALYIEVFGRPSDVGQPLLASADLSMLERNPPAKKKPFLSLVVDLAAGEPGRRERILALFCRYRVPSTGLAVAYWAQQLLDAILSTNFELPELMLVMEDLEWLATSPEVSNLCPTPHTRGGNPTVGHCATSAPDFAATCQTHADPQRAYQYSKLRAKLFLLLTGNAVSEVERAHYEHSIQVGEMLPPLSEGACAASRAIRYLATSAAEPMAILDKLSLDLPPAEFVGSLSSVEVPESPEALSRFRAFRTHLSFLLENAPRLKASRGPHKPSPSSPQAQSSARKHGSRSGSRKTEVHLTILKPKVDQKTARACAEADASSHEIKVDDQLVVCDIAGENADPVRIEFLTREQMRNINRPIQSMPWSVRGLSDTELAPLLRAAFRVAQDHTAGMIVDFKRLMASCLLMVVLFLARSLEEAADVILYGPGTTKPDVEIAIYLAGDPAEDRIRLEAIQPDYATEDPGVADNVHHPAGYIWLPLPSLLGLVLRASFAVPWQAVALAHPQKLFTLTTALRESVFDILAELDPSGRLNMSRLRSTLPARIWEQTSGDLMLSSLILGRKHPSMNSEIHYDGDQLLHLATLYREVTES